MGVEICGRGQREVDVSVAGISSSSFFDYAQSIQNRGQQFRQDFQQLGQDLQSGNTSSAQSDLAKLESLQPQAGTSPSTQSNNPITEDLKQLGQDLQSGNTSAAEQDYAKIQQDFQSQAAKGHGHHHHHGGGGGAGDITQTLDQLGQDLQSGNLSTAQQAYNSLEQEFQLFAESNGSLLSTATASGSAGSSVSVSA